jgi:hypothetical protein
MTFAGHLWSLGGTIVYYNPLLFWAGDCLLARSICSTLDDLYQHDSTNDIVSVNMVFVCVGIRAEVGGYS